MHLNFLLQTLCFVTAIITLDAKLSDKNNPIIHLTHYDIERYDSTLNRINSLDLLEIELKKRIGVNVCDTNSLLDTLDFILRDRFYHGYSEYSFKDNWILKILGEIFWQDFKFIVNPDDILRHPMAACSQQGMVFQAMLKRLGIKWATIVFFPTKGMSGHFAVSAFYNNNWHFFDTNLEPKKILGNPSFEELMQDSIFIKMYAYDTSKLNFINSKLEQNAMLQIKPMEYNAPNMLKFHIATNFLSDWLWAILGTFFICKKYIYVWYNRFYRL